MNNKVRIDMNMKSVFSEAFLDALKFANENAKMETAILSNR